MLIMAPIEHRDTNAFKKCAYCGHIQTEEEGLSAENFYLDEHFLDFCPVNLQKKYFNEKYVMCDNCGNVGKHITTNNIVIIGEEQYQEFLKIIDETERKLLIMHTRYNSIETLLDLYWYYEYKNSEISQNTYREEIINYCLSHNDVANKLLLVEIYRRCGLFDEAISVIKSLKSINTEKYYGLSIKDILKQQKRLCKEKNNERKIMIAK